MKKLVIILFCFLTHLTIAQRDFDKVEIKETLIDTNFYMLQGSGGNILVYIGEKEVLMVDSQFAPLSEKIKAKIDELADSKPIAYLINTHFHGDHTGGNENFGEAQIVAHENVRTRLSKDQFYKAFDRTVKAKEPGFWPELTYSESMNLYFEDQQIYLVHLPSAHTDGDTGVAFMDANIVHMGDTFFKDRFPYIDLSSGGTISGYIQAVEDAMFFMDEQTNIVPGHGDLADAHDLENYLKMLKTMRSRVEDQIKLGKSIEEIKAAGLDKGYEEWGTGFINADKFVDTIWTDLTRDQK